MQPKLNENPKDWLKFITAVCIISSLVIAGLSRRGLIRDELAWTLFAIVFTLLCVCALNPRWFRPLYRVGMSMTFYLGQAIGGVLLVVIFLVVVTPLGLILRLLGKDLLRLRRNPAAATYWQPAKSKSRLDQQF